MKLKLFTVTSAAHGRRALTQLISACPSEKKKKSRSETITEVFSVQHSLCQIDYRSNYSSCSPQNRLADVEEPRVTSRVGVGKSVVQLF